HVVQPFGSIRVRGRTAILQNLILSNLSGVIGIRIKPDLVHRLNSSIFALVFVVLSAVPSRPSSHGSSPFEILRGNLEWLLSGNE
ncbi:hypothetical protein PMAYCL1PPCAC_01697, partial [Pristionchus mayeri]